MNDITELERRILFALERIGTGVEGFDPHKAGIGLAPLAESSIEMDVLKAELEAERSANAQLTERVRAIKDKQENMVVALERNVVRLTKQLEEQGAELQRQRRLNDNLNDVNKRLSDAVLMGLSDPSTLNSALMSEVEALRASRKAEMAEVEEILAELKPLVGEVA